MKRPRWDQIKLPKATIADMGPNYYIETVNTSIGIYRKSDGSSVAAFTFNTYMSQGNSGSLRDTNNFGDLVALGDRVLCARRTFGKYIIRWVGQLARRLTLADLL